MMANAIHNRDERGLGRRRMTIWVILVVLFGLALPATATTSQVAISGTQQVVDFQPGECWMSGSIQHMRGAQSVSVLSPVSGLPHQGLATATVNFNLDVRTGQGRAWGKGSLVFEGGGFETTFAGDVSSGPNGLEGVFRVVGHGYGVFEGMQVRVIGYENLNTGSTTFEGVLFEPGEG
jgi:hypothetical protein